MSEKSFHDYLKGLKGYRAGNPHQREGQAAMNYLYIFNSNLYHNVTNKGRDCFFDDDRLPEFYAWLRNSLS